MHPSLEHWIFCQCSDDACAFRFPAAASDRRQQQCPLCGAPTRCTQPDSPSMGQSALADDGVRTDAASDRTTRTEIHLLLDNLRSSYNVGSLFRTADGAGIAHLHLCGITPTPSHTGVGKTALGAEARIPWTYHRNALRAASELQQAEYRLWALETISMATSLFAADAPRTGSLVLAIGNEIAGVDPGLLAQADRIVRLPMMGGKRSLNVASAAAVALYWLRFGAR